MEPESATEIWTLPLDSVRPGDFLHVCTEPDDILRVTSNLNAVRVRSILYRVIEDLELAAGLREGSARRS